MHEVVNRWWVEDDWWRVPISRTYYWVITPTMLLEVYHDDIAGDWYLQRVMGTRPIPRYRPRQSRT